MSSQGFDLKAYLDPGCVFRSYILCIVYPKSVGQPVEFLDLGFEIGAWVQGLRLKEHDAGVLRALTSILQSCLGIFGSASKRALDTFALKMRTVTITVVL